MDLAKLIVKSKTVEIEYPGSPDLKVSVAYLTREELKGLRDKCVTQKFNKKTRQPEEDVDTDLFQDLYVDAIIKGWAGFKYKYLEKMLPLDTSSIPEVEYKEGEGFFAYTPEAAKVLMKNAVDFDAWVTDLLDDVGNFTTAS